MTIIFDKIKEVSNLRGMSIDDVNYKAGLSNKAIYGWKKSTPKADNLEKVADVLNVSMDYLLGRIDEMNPTASNDLTEPQKQVAYFIDPQATKEDIEQIKKLVEIAKLSKRRL
ncbi:MULTISPECIES: helix-turn-helix domain-containing protein [Leuconostoc]|uniref:helix-turn-helix domain-containing protein n=1 Tax=Leuconostoc TaxID=1243 RepID=UPI0007783F6E|nr:MULTISPECIES: helix-turn-helix domain-containing protein [Leuconostoc]API72634.1 transcriptional regulator [Leuconostoc suionicum]MBZ1502922.1 helix-turn-helix domain-containing protein [Leuconostoc mesenteroides]MCT3052268.1 helix-turn-helix domain-containing protein [Leuconostoc mesenteroides]TDV87772.1 Cro/C1-type helix-turn-helix DNA-binding protein [Leuconostoc mesenteroides]BAX71305.1 XRE family transcriptional regulator [Leuconostoc suionicum]